MNALTPILEYKQDEVRTLKANRTVSSLESEAESQAPPRGFARALTDIAERGQNGLICELKRKSPSAGEILPGADPISIAREYQAGGAACLSVLTDGPSFGGSMKDLEAIKQAVDLPILRKDFMIDPVQIIEARAHGADAILIIMAAIDDMLASELLQTTTQLGMDALIEIHNELELARALSLRGGLLGINNRDLTKMTTDLSVSERLSVDIPAGTPFVSESGVKTPEDIRRLRKIGATRFLIGESLMLSPNRKALVSELRSAGSD